MASTTKSFQISKGLYLISQSVETGQKAAAVETPTNHILVVDCSGSMSYDLPQMRDQIKKKLPKMVKEGDTLSIIWFSGRGQYGVLIEAEPVATLADLTVVNQAVDRWLKPVGLTGFKQPIEEVGRLIERLSKKANNHAFSLFFMSDGCDNEWNRKEVIDAVEKTAQGLSAATMVEYGNYADRPLLTQMAEKMGGSLIFAKDFDRFMPLLEAALQKRAVGGKKVTVEVGNNVLYDFAFALHDKELLTFAVEKGQVSVPENVTTISYLSNHVVGKEEESVGDLAEVAAKATSFSSMPNQVALDTAYAAVSLFSVRMKPDVVFPLLSALGDVQFIDQFAGCFGKQKYTEFMEAAKSAAFEKKSRFTKGRDPNRVPKEDAFTVLELLNILSEDEENKLLLDHPAFNYNRIGRGRVDASSILSDEEQAEVDTLTKSMTGVKDAKKLKAIQGQIQAILDAKGEPLKFVEDPAPNGYSISNLTFNEERPNISVLIRKTGKVDLSKKLPKEFAGNKVGNVPTLFSTFVFRNYAIVKDGMINVPVLPVRITRETAKKLEAANLPAGTVGVIDVTNRTDGDFLIDLTKLPIVNRKMVKATSAKTLFELEYELTKARAIQKVFNSFKKERELTKKSETFEALYGAKATAWLKEEGFTEYSGFSPSSRQAESTDFYMSKELSVSLKGYSTIPSLNDFRKQASKGKFNGPGTLMKPAVEEVEAFLKSDFYKEAPNQDELFETWITGKAKEATNRVRELIYRSTEIKFSVVVGQVWFTEFASVEENTLSISVDNLKLDGKVEMKEVQTKI